MVFGETDAIVDALRAQRMGVFIEKRETENRRENTVSQIESWNRKRRDRSTDEC
jgi:hypothetical protein